MQISRHWRMSSQRYRLEGVRYQTGELSLQVRPTPRSESPREGEPRSQPTEVKVAVPVTR
jgi:hypothetical protein